MQPMMVYAPSPPDLPLKQAQRYAHKIAEWIAPYCLQIEPVGRIRRECASCLDVDLLVIPRFHEGKQRLFDFLDDYVRQSKSRAFWHNPVAFDMKGQKPAPDALDVSLLLPKCTLALHCATPETWFLRLFETTGSESHCSSVRHELRPLDGEWHRGKCISIAGRDILPKCEGEIYELVKRPFVPPKRRTA
jgi:hypothetical protein